MPNRVYRRTVRVAWGDCDPAQIVFYPRYYEMFDESAQELFRDALGMPKIQWVKRFAIVGIPLVETRAKYFVPSYYGDDIMIESSVTAFRRSSFDLSHKIFKGETLSVDGFETRVWAAADPARPGGIKSAPIPADVLAAFEV